MPNRRAAERDMGSIHDGCGPQHPPMEGLTIVPVDSSSNSYASTFQPTLSFAPTPGSVPSYSAPEGYYSDQRDSPVSDAIGSLYAWSNPSTADLLRLSASPVECSAGVTASTPSMHSYYGYDSSQRPIQPQLADASQCNHQEINRWCMESDPADGLYPNPSPYAGVNQLPVSTEMPASSYPPFGETFDAVTEQFFSLPTPDSLSTSLAPGLLPKAFLSPSSAPAAPLDSPSAMSNSPEPSAISDFESSSCRHQPSSPPSSSADLSQYGIPTPDGAWRCAYPGCTSQSHFRRGCDLRKHFNRHRRYLFCRHDGCPQSRHGGFSSKKDRARHESKHNPGVVCDWEGCGRVFSRVDNMKDHVRRIHRRGASD